MLLICKRRLPPADPDSVCKACTAAASQASACARLRRRSDQHEANRIFRVSRQRRAGTLGILLVAILAALSFPTTQAITIYPGTDVVQVRHGGRGSIGNVLVPLYTEGHPLVTTMGLFCKEFARSHWSIVSSMLRWCASSLNLVRGCGVCPWCAGPWEWGVGGGGEAASAGSVSHWHIQGGKCYTGTWDTHITRAAGQTAR
jgi:hypothetical protein